MSAKRTTTVRRITRAELRARRLPLEPLYAAAGGEMSQRALCRKLGMSHGRVSKWTKRGGLDVYEADVAAIALGLHPTEVWGMAWEQIPIASDLLGAA